MGVRSQDMKIQPAGKQKEKITDRAADDTVLGDGPIVVQKQMFNFQSMVSWYFDCQIEPPFGLDFFIYCNCQKRNCQKAIEGGHEKNTPDGVLFSNLGNILRDTHLK